jgi:hypothetical protein
VTRRTGAVAVALGLSLVAAPIVAAVLMRSGDESASAAQMAGMTASSGMRGATYWKQVSGGAFHSDGRTRTYYIRADEVVWDYAPRRRNEITGKPFDEVADTYVKSGPGRIGSRYVKCLYRGYTDDTFTQLQQRPVADRYLGFLGPVIRAEVGDTIEVVFRNACSFPTTVHPHGVFYEKDGEGSPYNDGTTAGDKADDGVPTGGTHTYRWQVPDRAGPGPDDGSSVMWMYHSHTNEVSDTYAGLIGPMEITQRGMAREDGSPVDVDREVFALFTVMNESASPLLEKSLTRFAKRPYPHDLDDDDFVESNLMHSINGYVFGNQPLITLRKGERIRWYVMSMGTEVDLHTPTGTATP